MSTHQIPHFLPFNYKKDNGKKDYAATDECFVWQATVEYQ